MSFAPEKDTAAALTAAGTMGSASIQVGVVVPADSVVKDLAVFCQLTRSPKPTVYHGGTVGLRGGIVSATVRSNVDAYDAGETLCAAVFAALHGLPPAGYVDCVAMEDGFVRVLQDQVGHHLWTCNFLLTYEA